MFYSELSRKTRLCFLAQGPGLTPGRRLCTGARREAAEARSKFLTGFRLTKPRSVVSNRPLAEITRDEGGDVEEASTGDPSPRSPVKSKEARTPKKP